MLENAAWPAFLVDDWGIIRKANQAAIALFGAKLESDATMLSALWAEETESAEQFLTRWERSTAAVAPLRLLGKGAAVTTFSTHISEFHLEEERRVFVSRIPAAAAGLAVDK